MKGEYSDGGITFRVPAMTLTTDDIIDALMLKFPPNSVEEARAQARTLDEWINEQIADFLRKMADGITINPASDK